MARVADTHTQQHWLRHLRRWQSSRLTVRQYCQDHDLSEASFYAWKRRLRQRGLLVDATSAPASTGRDGTASQTPLFLPVAVAAVKPTTAPIDLVLPDGLTVRVAAGFDAATLRQLLALLREQPC
jgi:transposase-like protein